MNNKALLRSRVDKLLADKNVETVTDIVPYGDPLYQKVYRQLFNNKDSDITYDVLNALLVKFEDTSAEWLIRGEGLQTRTKIVTPPQHRQDIHLDAGATAAISQNGEAKVEAPAPKDEQNSGELFTPSELARMMREQDVAGLVSIILQQKDEIIRIQREHITSMRAEMQFVDKTMFPPVK